MNKIISTAPIIVAAVFLTACQTQPAKENRAIDDMREIIKTEQQQAGQAIEPPASISAAMLPSIDLGVGMSEQEQERFDVRVSNAQARDFFMGLVDQSPHNMVVHPDVDGTVSLNLKNVTVDEVMRTLRDVYGYEYNKTSAGYQVLPFRLQSKIFYVNYLNLVREGESSMTVNSGRGTSDDSESGGSSSDTAAKVTTKNKSDVWQDLENSLQSIIGLSEEGENKGRNITISRQSGIVVVRAMPSELREVEFFLREMQSSLQRQVILEAKILEVELSDGYQAGINWAAVGKADGGSRSVAIGQTGGGSVFDGTDLVNTSLQGQSGNLNSDTFSAIDAFGAAAFGGVFSAAVTIGNFNAFIELLESQGNVQVLSSPRVSTMNNQKAIIKVGQDEYFVTDISSTTTTGGGATSSTPDIEFTRFFSGIALDVTPQIDRDGTVTLHIHPSVSEVSDQTKNLVIDGEAQSLPLALSSVRESDNIVRARNGQLVVIGGLMKNSTSENQASVPVLGDMPFVGSAFRHTKQTSRKSELVILLRPIVVDPNNTWNGSLSETSSRLDELDRGFHVGGHPDVFGTEGEGQ
jgi:MSHA biogenesis protein MshL